MLCKIYIFAVLIVIGIIYFKFFRKEKFTTSSTPSSSAPSNSQNLTRDIEKYIEDKVNEKISNMTQEKIIAQVNKIYDIDVESIRNLGAISQSLLTGKNYHNINGESVEEGTLKIPANVVIDGELRINKRAEILPIGTIIACSTKDVPSGWARCDGSYYKKSIYKHDTTYADKIDETKYLSISDKDIYIYAPDLRDRFLLGYDVNGDKNLLSTGGTDMLGVEHIPPHKHAFTRASGVENSIRTQWGIDRGGNIRQDWWASKLNYDRSLTDEENNHDLNNSEITQKRYLPKYTVIQYIMRI
jgi:microcystin-dependent protein